MKEYYNINEILTAINELQNRTNKKVLSKKNKTPVSKKNDIPSNTLKLIEQAEKTINKS